MELRDVLRLDPNNADAAKALYATMEQSMRRQEMFVNVLESYDPPFRQLAKATTAEGRPGKFSWSMAADTTSLRRELRRSGPAANRRLDRNIIQFEPRLSAT